MTLKYKKFIKDEIVSMVKKNPAIESEKLISIVLIKVRKLAPMEDAELEKYRESISELASNFLEALQEDEED